MTFIYTLVVGSAALILCSSDTNVIGAVCRSQIYAINIWTGSIQISGRRCFFDGHRTWKRDFQSLTNWIWFDTVKDPTRALKH